MFWKIHPVLLVLACASGFAPAVAAQEAVTISSPRVLGELVARLQQRGYLVTYEEAPYDSETELSTTVYPDGTRFRAPLSRTELFHLPAAAPDSDGHVVWPDNSQRGLAFVEQLVSDFNKSGNPGNFKVSFDGGYANIMPAGRRLNGKLETFDAVLNTKVVFPPQARLCAEALQDLFDQLRQLRGVDVVEGNMPVNGLLRHSCAVTGNDLTARQVLIQLLAQMAANRNPNMADVTYAWELYHDANWDKYFLSAAIVPIAAVPSPRTSSEGAKPNAGPSANQGLLGQTVAPSK